MKLFSHQSEAVAWLAMRRRAGLFDDQGLGKTAASLVAADLVGAERVLVVCPSVVSFNWQREARAWVPRWRSQVITAGDQRPADAANLVVVSHGLLLRDELFSALATQAWDVVLLDECQFFRNPKARRTKRFYGDPFKKDVANLVRRNGYVWILSGTPMPNNPTELWTMLAGLDPRRAATVPGGPPMRWKQWRDRFCVLASTSYGDGLKPIAIKNADELRTRLKGFALRRMKRDVLNLPPIRFGTVALTVGKLPQELLEIEREFRAVWQKSFRAIQGDATIDSGAFLQWLRDSEHFARWSRLCGLAKAPAAAELVSMELDSGLDKIVLFAHHRDVIDALATELAAYKPVRIVGGMTAQQKSDAAAIFQQRPEHRVALCNIVAGGVGVTLTAACEAAFVEQSWVPGDNAQATDRINRIGQTRPVQVRTFSLAGSIDEIVDDVLLRKMTMIREVKL